MLAGIKVFVTDDICKVCSEQDSPKGLNKVTCGVATKACKQAGIPISEEIKLCLTAKTEGIGTEVERIIYYLRGFLGPFSKWFTPKKGCDCGSIKNNFNALSIVEAERHKIVLSDKIVENWYKMYPNSIIPKQVVTIIAFRIFIKAINLHATRLAERPCNAKDS